MIKIIVALALTIGGLLALMFVCYLVTYIPFVKLGLEIDENYSIITRMLYGFTFIIICILTLISVLIILGASFMMFYCIL